MNHKSQPQTAAVKNTGQAFSKLTASPWLQIMILVFVCAAVYINSLPNGFVFDDYAVIVENKYLKLPGINLAAFFDQSYFNVAGGEASYRPLATLSYYLIYAIAGLNPFFYHLLSVLLHAVNVVLIYRLVHWLLRQRFTALTAGLLFACHPALTEAVDAIAYNEDLLAAAFFLAALLFYLRSSTANLRSRRFNYGCSLLFFWLGLLSKEMAITLPAMILLYDLSFRDGADKKSFSWQWILNTIKARGLFYGGYLAVGLLYVFIRFFVLYNPEEAIKPIYGNWVERILFLPAHIFSFIKLAFFPVHLTADYVFSYPPHFFAASNLIGFLVVAGLAVGSVFIFKHSRGIFFAIWWFFIALFPVYNIIPIYNPLAERFLYIPLIGFCMLVAMAFNTLMHQRFSERMPVKVFASVAVIALLSFYATTTISRNRDWKDSLTLWSKTVITSPDSSIAHGSLGRAYQDLARWADAIRAYKKAIALFPDNYKAYYNLGVLYDRQGDAKEAVANYKRTLAINPAFINAHFNLANIYFNQGLLEAAIRHYRQVTELDPADFEARNNLGVAYARQGKLDQAIAEWQKVLQMDPRNKSAADNLNKAKGVVD